MVHSFRRLVAFAFVVVACGSDPNEEPVGDPPAATPRIESKPLHDAALGGTGATVDGSVEDSVRDDGGGGAGGGPEASADGGDIGANRRGDDADARGDGESSDSDEPEVLAAEDCNLAAPFDAPVAAFTRAMNANGLNFSADGQTAYISGPGTAGNDIFVATRPSPDEAFGTPAPLTGFNTSANERSPSLSADGLTLMLTANVPNLMNDTVRAVRNASGSFDPWQTIGTPLNSSVQDEDPFWWGSNTLYFASERPNGEQRDVWTANWDGTNFQQLAKVQNVDPNPNNTVNSEFEEFHPVLSPDGLTLYFSSRRYGIGGDQSGDIWMAQRTSTDPRFSPPVNLWGLNTTGIDFPVNVSPNGCTLYFASNEETGLGSSPNSRLYQATRGASIPAQVTLRLNILGTGSVMTSPFQCSTGNAGACSASRPPDTTMLVMASPPAQWTGSCTGNGSQPSTDGILTFSQNAVCTIKFPDGTLVGPGGLCSLSMDCQQGLECTNGACRCPPGTQCSARGETCSADNDCQAGLVCWLEGARHFDKPGGTGVCAPPVCRDDPILGGCGDVSSPCGRCEGTPRPCASTADCIPGEVCGTNNGAAFMLPADGDFCWPPDCDAPATTPARCGTTNSACGICDCSANCAGRECGDSTDDHCGGYCVGLCNDGEAGCASSLDCPAGSVCGVGIGPRFGHAVGSNVCWPADCADQDPTLPNGGVDLTRCGVSPACVPTCEPGDTGPDGCGGYCGDCIEGEERQEDGNCGPLVTFARRSGIDLPDPLPVMPTNEVGATPGSFSVTDRGQASYSIPLQVPPGRLGVQPNLALQYLSTKADGMLGIGWSLTGLSTITRCRRFLDRDSVNAAVRFNASDRFCLDGQALFQIGGGVYGHEGVEYRTEVDSFSKIVSHGSTMDGGGRYVGPEWFEVRTKDGRILTYGKEGSSTVDVSFPTGTPGNRGQVIRVWALNRVEDRAGNYLDIAYKKYQSVVVPADGQGNPNAQIASTGEILPATISYGGNNSDRAFAHAGHDHSRFVRFSYGNRPDPTHHYASGVQGYSRKRLERVDTFVGKVFVKSYVLRYEDMLDASKLPPFQLEEVQECSDDATGERKCLPATEFRYYLQQDFGPLQSVGTGCPFNYTALTGGGRDGFVCDSVGVNPVDIDGNGAEEGSLWKFADVTGDGLKDRYECIETAGRTTFDIQVNLGGFEFAPVAHVNIAIPPALVPVSMRCDDLIVMDADSDGDDDFLMGTSAVIVGPPEHQVQGNAGMYRLSLTPASGNTFVGEWVLATPTGLHLRRPGPTGVCCEPPNQQILDFNGDGLKDIIALESGRFLLWTNTGVGFDVQALTGDEFNGGLWDSIVMDYDGDGREDIVFTGGTWFRYAGPGAIERRALSVPPNAGRGAMLFDEDGDGSPGLFHPNLLGPHGELRTWGSSFSARSRLLHSVTDGVGKRVTVKYDGDSAFGRTLNLGTCVPTSITKCGNKVGPLVSETELSQLRSESTPARERLLSYQYFGSTIGLRGRGSFGFTRRVVASPLHQTEYLYNTSDFVRAGRATEITTTPRNAMPSPLGDEERFETTTLQWGIFHSGAQQPFPFLSRQVRTVYNGFSEPSIVGRDDLIRDPPDVFGNETSVTSASVSSSTIVDVTTTVTHWFNDPDLWVIGLADDVTIASTRGDTDTRFIDYGYDLNRRLLTNISRQGGPPGAFDPAQHRHTTLTRDDFGNIDETCVGDISLITRCGRVLERDNENVFATRLEDAQGMQSEYIFALEDGQLLAAMDPNGILSERGFDAFGRPQQVRSPTANGSFTYAHEDQTVSAFLFNVRGAISLTSNFAGTGPRKTVFDAFGRVVQTQVPGFGGAVVYTDRQYDNLGRLTVESVPHTPANIAEGLIDYHYDGVGRLSKITQPDGNATEYFYTNIQAANFDFTLFIGDHPATLSMVKLPRGNTRLTVRDASGMVSFTAEAPLVSRAGETHTTFKHGPFGALTEVFAPQGRTTYDNDDWGRTRVVSDPALGMRILTYNGFDERVRETDARGEVNVYDYDRLGRLVEKRNDAGDVIARWDFDGPPELNQQGRLVGSWRRSSADLEDAEGTWVLNHYEGPNGLPSAVVYHVGATIDDPLGGEVFATQVSYDESVPGRLSGVTYPSNGGAFRIAYDYDSEPAGDAWIGSGAIRSVAPADEQGPTGDAYWTLTAADEGYRLAEERFGNDVVSTRTYYDPGECANDPGVSCAGRLKEITTDLPGETRFANHAWDANGNLASLSRGATPSTMFFEYDHLDRLTREHFSINGVDATAREYAYNNAGDLTLKTGAGSYTYEPRGIVGSGSELRSVGSTTYWYDENGNQTERIGPLAERGYQRLDYNDFDMPERVVSGDILDPGRTTIELEYTASGQRVVERTSSLGFTTERTHAGDLYERTKRIPLLSFEHRYKILVGSRQVAEVVRIGNSDTDPDVFYLHDDHLGSVTTITDSGGGVVETRGYEPFGGMTANGTTGVRASFTGHDQDRGLGLVNARGRLYDQKIGRFVSPDPFTTNPGSSQGWNRYAYVENNPLAFTDPTGFCEVPVMNYCQPGTSYCHTITVPCDVYYGHGGSGQGGSGGASSGENNGAGPVPTAQEQYEAAQKGFGEGEAAATRGQPQPGYAQPALSSMPPDVDPADLVSRDPGPDWHYECGYSASCFPGDDQGAFEEEEVEEYEDRVGAFGRLPDFYQFELSATLAPLGKYSSGVGVAVIDREGQFFVGAGAGASFPAGAPVSGSFQLGWINQDATPNAAQLREFLRGFGFSLVLGYWGGGGVQINLGDGSSATMLGLVPPGVDASVTYSGKVP